MKNKELNESGKRKARSMKKAFKNLKENPDERKLSYKENLASACIRMSGVMDENTKYYPKGGMCTGCNKQMNDCSDLPFNTMIIIGFDKNTNTATVRCTDHDPKPKDTK